MSTITSSYLTEDLAQIMRYFPGAQPIALNTPFDLTDRTVKRKTKHSRTPRPDQTPTTSSPATTNSVLAACLIPFTAHQSSPWTT